MICREAVEHAAALEVAGHYAVTVKQDDGSPTAALEKVEAYPVHVEERAGRRMPVGPSSLTPHHQNSGRREGDGG